jgi:hypothetical protein
MRSCGCWPCAPATHAHYVPDYQNFVSVSVVCAHAASNSLNSSNCRRRFRFEDKFGTISGTLTCYQRISMQREDLFFLISDLPDNTTQKLLSSYLSLFGKVESCTYHESTRCATVFFSASDDPEKVLNARHRFLGSPIRVMRARAGELVSDPLAPDSSHPAPHHSISTFGSSAANVSASCDSKPRPAAPGRETAPLLHVRKTGVSPFLFTRFSQINSVT